MTLGNRLLGALRLGLMLSFLGFSVVSAADPLPSWNDGKTKQSVIAFVEKVTKEGSPEFVPADRRIATFDNDGTLWAEQPLYFQLIYAIDKVKEMAPQHPEWKKGALRIDHQGRHR
ncbi:hypothetical protein [Microbulbifer taiwanensis]|uniref:hypothetical protein n=1 Tax=Microbulbifer taiwanensis TaxID=986746 RepID=UPI0036066B1A